MVVLWNVFSAVFSSPRSSTSVQDRRSGSSMRAARSTELEGRVARPHDLHFHLIKLRTWSAFTKRQTAYSLLLQACCLQQQSGVTRRDRLSRPVRVSTSTNRSPQDSHLAKCVALRRSTSLRLRVRYSSGTYPVKPATYREVS